MPQCLLRNLGKTSHGRRNRDIRMSDRTWECRDWNAQVRQFSRFWMRPHPESGKRARPNTRWRGQGSRGDGHHPVGKRCPPDGRNASRAVDHFVRNEVENLFEDDHLGPGRRLVVHHTLAGGRDFRTAPAIFSASVQPSCGIAAQKTIGLTPAPPP